MNSRSVSVVVPTFREAENLPTLIHRLRSVAAAHALEIELLIVDDRSDDDTAEVVAALGEENWVKLLVREGERSLSLAVIEGLRLARRETLVVMDADLSHPPEVIPRLLDALSEPGVEFVIGSRFVSGSSIDEDWSPLRHLSSLVARWLARPLTSARDATSGFFALRRATFLAAHDLQPIGYKIGLELIVKCRATNVREVPIHFGRRLRGQSKLDLRECIRYLRHVSRLMGYRIVRRWGDAKRSVVA